MGAASEALIDALRRLLRGLQSPIQLPVRGRVVKVHERGGRSTLPEPRYSVDVEVLDEEGQPDPAWPVIPDCELPMLWAGKDRGLVAVPDVGAHVRVGFYRGDRNQPYVEGVLATGFQVPDHPRGRWLLYSDEAVLELTPAGDLVLRAGTIRCEGKVVADSLYLGDNQVPGSDRTGAIVITPQSAVTIQVRNGMIVGWT